MVTGPVVTIQNGLKSLIKTAVTAVQNRVYVPGDTVSTQMPRVTIVCPTPVERLIIGSGNSNGPTWRDFNAKIDVWDRLGHQQSVDTVADAVINAISNNRYVTPTGGDGNWPMIWVSGGGETRLNESTQVYQRTIRVSGKFLQTS